MLGVVIAKLPPTTHTHVSMYLVVSCFEHVAQAACLRVSRAIPPQQSYLLAKQGAFIYRYKTEAAVGNRRAHEQSANEQFQQHFATLYGSERWKRLWAALQQPTQHVAFANPFTADDSGRVSPVADSSRMQLSTAEQVCMAAGWSRVHSNLPFYHITRHQTSAEVTHGRDRLHNTAVQAQSPHAHPQLSTCSNDPTDDPPAATHDSLSHDLLKLGHTASHAPTGCQLLYFLDLSSALPVLALNPQPGMKVLDMCAAPGGKSLLLAAQLLGKMQLMPDSPPPYSAACSGSSSSTHCHTIQEQQQQGEEQFRQQPATAAVPSHSADAAAVATAKAGKVQFSHLTCNDRSTARRARLRSVMHSYLPGEYHNQIEVTGHDAARWHQFHPSVYDAVLLDAPCSSERHLAQHSSSSSSSRPAVITRQRWSISRTKRNASMQLSLLISAGRCVKPGGLLVYSTCSINPEENDQVVEKACKRLRTFGVTVQCITTENWQQLQHSGFDIPGIEGDDLGMVVLPDSTGWGPLYWRLLQRTQ